MKHLKTLDGVQNWLNDIDDINAGGCGISALSIYRWLKNNNKLVGDESFTYLYNNKDYFYLENSRVLRTKFTIRRKRKLNSCSHIMLFHNGKNIDSKGEYIPSRYTERHIGITEKQLIESINFGGWNCSFERDYNVPNIEVGLQVDLSDVNINYNN